MTSGWRWGKAGQRLTDSERQQRDARRRAERDRSRYSRAASDQVAREKWAAGLMVPARITLALDMHSLYGPEVDAACGASEPDVDLWEAGLLYPAWEQVLLLSQLTGCAPRFFMDEPPVIKPEWTSLRFHTRLLDNTPDPVLRFTDEAVRDMKAREEAGVGIRPDKVYLVHGDGGVTVTKTALSPKLGVGERTFYWQGPDEQRPGAALWTTDAAGAARFPTIEAAEAALGTLNVPPTIAATQEALW